MTFAADRQPGRRGETIVHRVIEVGALAAIYQDSPIPEHGRGMLFGPIHADPGFGSKSHSPDRRFRRTRSVTPSIDPARDQNSAVIQQGRGVIGPRRD